MKMIFHCPLLYNQQYEHFSVAKKIHCSNEIQKRSGSSTVHGSNCYTDKSRLCLISQEY